MFGFISPVPSDPGGVSLRLKMITPIAVVLCLMGCASAYDQTYNQEMGRLHSQ